jgi:2-deoxy-D-gluconate 3-dehydrogenase
MMEQVLKDKVIVISGGTKGVGKTMAEECAIRGAKVVIAGRDEKEARSSIRLMRSYNTEGLFVRAELTNVEDCRHIFDATVEQFGKVDGFFNYAGITPISPLDTCSPETFDAVMNINFRAAFFCCQQAIKYMRKNGGGSIVLTGSAHAWGGQKDRAAYACSKGVLLTLIWTPTEGEVALRKAQGISEAELRVGAAKVLPMGRMCERADYVEGIAYLLSDASSMMTGSTFRITAGEYI